MGGRNHQSANFQRPHTPANRALLLTGIEARFTLLHGARGRITTAPAFLPVVNATGNRREELQPCGLLVLCPVGVSYASLGVGAIPFTFGWRAQNTLAFAWRAMGMQVVSGSQSAFLPKQEPISISWRSMEQMSASAWLNAYRSSPGIATCIGPMEAPVSRTQVWMLHCLCWELPGNS